MATIVCGHRVNDGVNIFYTEDRQTFRVIEFKDGVVTLDPLCGTMFEPYAKAVAGCFRIRSNFKSELAKAFVGMKTIEFDFNGATVVVEKENSNTKQIYEQWRKKMEELAERERVEEEEYKKTPEYRAKRAKELKFIMRRESVEKAVLAISETEQLEFKNEQAAKEWAEWVKINSNDGYSLGVVTYATRWAKYMQHLMRKHNKTVEDIAEQTRIVCDIDGATGFMYGQAVGALAQFWKYGDELKKWHNKQYGLENYEETVNPAVITRGSSGE